MSETPRTDEAMCRYTGGEPVTFPQGISPVVPVDFARLLERELTEAIKERDAEFDRAERHRLAEFRLREQLSAMRKRCEKAETNTPRGGEVGSE